MQILKKRLKNVKLALNSWNDIALGKVHLHSSLALQKVEEIQNRIKQQGFSTNLGKLKSKALVEWHQALAFEESY